MTANYDKRVDDIVRVVYEAVRTYKITKGERSLLPWVDAPFPEKAFAYLAVNEVIGVLAREEEPELPNDPTTEEILILNIIFALVGDE